MIALETASAATAATIMSARPGIFSPHMLCGIWRDGIANVNLDKVDCRDCYRLRFPEAKLDNVRAHSCRNPAIPTLPAIDKGQECGRHNSGDGR